MKGQNLVEFSIIGILIILVSFISLKFLGNNISTMFSSSKNQYENYEPFGKNVEVADEGSEFELSKDFKVFGATGATGADGANGLKVLSSSMKPRSIGGTDVMFDRANNTASFTVGEQNVTLSSEVLDKLDTVFQTAGAEGLNDYVVQTIKEMILNNQSDYLGQDVPIEIDFGQSVRDTRTKEEEITSFIGTADFNQVTISVGNNVSVLINDQSCSSDEEYDQKHKGVYKISGVESASEGSILFTFSGKIEVLQSESVNNVLDGLGIKGVVENKDGTSVLALMTSIDSMADDDSTEISQIDWTLSRKN